MNNLNIQSLKQFALRLPEPIKTLILSQPDELSQHDLISKFFEWKKLIKLQEMKK